MPDYNNIVQHQQFFGKNKPTHKSGIYVPTHNPLIFGGNRVMLLLYFKCNYLFWVKIWLYMNGVT